MKDDDWKFIIVLALQMAFIAFLIVWFSQCG